MDESTVKDIQVFICYRRNDGDWCAAWLNDHLNGYGFTDPEGSHREIHTYYDQKAPGVADWKSLHFPSLQSAHALILVCTPGVAKDFSKRGHPDWVYEELRWWCSNRHSAPIVVDATGEGDRWLPELVARKWPDLNRIELRRGVVEQGGSADDAYASGIRDRIVATIRQSEHRTVFEDLERMRRTSRRLRTALVISVALLAAAVAAGVLALSWNRIANSERNAAIARRLAAQSELVRGDNKSLVLSGLLAVEALNRNASLEEDRAARNTLELMPILLLSLANQTDTNNLALHMSRDGKTIVTAASGEDPGNGVAGTSEIVIWNAGTGQRITSLSHAGTAPAVATSADGSLIAAGFHDGKVAMWSVESGERVFAGDLGGAVKHVAFEPDGRRVAFAGYSPKILVVDVKELRIAHELFSHAPVLALKFSADGALLAFGTAPPTREGIENSFYIFRGVHGQAEDPVLGDSARVVDLSSGKEILQLEHEGAVFAIDFTLDGNHLATGCWDGQARVWDLHTGEEAAKIAYPPGVPVTSLAFTPDRGGSFIAMAGANGEVRLWEWRTREEYARFTHDGASHVAFSPDGLRLATVGGSVVRLWDLFARQEIARMTHSSSVTQVYFAPDGSWIASGGWDPVVWVWRPGTGSDAVRATHKGRVEAVCFSPDGTRLLSGGFDGSTRIWDVATAKEVFRDVMPAHVRRVQYSADGTRFAGGGTGNEKSGIVRVWDARTNARLFAKKLPNKVWSVALNGDGSLVAAGLDDGTARVWEVSSGAEVSRITHGEEIDVRSVAFDPRGRRVASGGLDGSVLVWEDHGGKEIHRFIHPSAVLAVDFSTDGTLIAAGTFAGEVKVWDLAHGREVAAFHHDDIVMSVDFSPNGAWVAVSSADGVVKVWDRNKGRPLRQIARHGAVNGVAFHPDGQTLATAGSDGTVRVFPIDGPRVASQICSRIPRNLYQQEWETYLGGQPYRKSCPRLAPGGERQERAGAGKAFAFKGGVAAFALTVNDFKSKGDPLDGLVEHGEQLARRGEIAEAIVAYEDAEAVAKQSKRAIPSDAWNRLCWNGTLAGHAREVLFACDRALGDAQGEAARNVPMFRDSRGLARALAGDVSGAVSDFEHFVKWCKEPVCPGSLARRREGWIEQLRSGANPFDATTLAALKEE